MFSSTPLLFSPVAFEMRDHQSKMFKTIAEDTYPNKDEYEAMLRLLGLSKKYPDYGQWNRIPGGNYIP
jgi:hypothetical protein